MWIWSLDPQGKHLWLLTLLPLRAPDTGGVSPARLHLCPPPVSLQLFLLTCRRRQSLLLVFRSLSEMVPLYIVVILVCPWEEVNPGSFYYSVLPHQLISYYNVIFAAYVINLGQTLKPLKFSLIFSSRSFVSLQTTFRTFDSHFCIWLKVRAKDYYFFVASEYPTAATKCVENIVFFSSLNSLGLLSKIK